MMVNCDIGERGAEHPVDRELMTWIGMANLACGGHAGDAGSVEVFRKLAEENGVQISAHLSYPDREGFGRISMDLSSAELLEALNQQWNLMPDATTVKFHGALYNDSVIREDLGALLIGWLLGKGVTRVICPNPSVLARLAGEVGIEVMAEAFVERRYQQVKDGPLTLVPRTDPRASIHDLAEALDQARDVIQRGGVTGVGGVFVPCQADTLCIHSDSPLALELAKGVHAILQETS